MPMMHFIKMVVGSTLKLRNLYDINGRCFDIKTLARLLYVAVTRAKEEVVFNGQLPYNLRG